MRQKNQKTTLTKKKRPHLLFIFVIFLGIFTLFSLQVGINNQATAQAIEVSDINNLADAKKACDIRVNPEQCLKNIKNCAPQNTTTCLRNQVRKVAPVWVVCRNHDDPQDCHRQVLAECASVRERQQCSRELASAIKAGPNALRPDGKIIRDTCGGPDNDPIETQIDFGCVGEGNPIIDLAYAIIRFLSFGVGLVLAAALIYAGIQYSTSGGSPEKTAAAKNQIQNVLIGLVLYLLIFALIQYLVPGGLFR